MGIRYLIVVVFLLGCSTSNSIKEKEVKRVLSALSSDEMMGRGLFNEGIEKAANFISDEFTSIGLASFNGVSSFKQTFNVHSLSIQDVAISINGGSISSSNYFLRMGSNSISWSLDNKPNIIFLDSTANFRDKAGEALSSKEDLLVVVAESHKAMFSKYQSYFSKPKLSFDEFSDDSSTPNLVFVLSNDVSIDALNVNASQSAKDKQLTNVVGVIEGNRANEIVLYSAHYDHLGTGAKIEEDSIYNGANDDASGVTAVIELARYFKSQPKPERTLLFVAFTAEEVGGFGSRYFSKQLNPDQIMAMLNIEMIGKESKAGLNSAWMSGWDKSDLGQILQKNLEKENFKFFADPYPDQQLFYRSDNATLARLGVPAHSISTTQIDIDTDYHQLSDEMETLDITNITNTIRAIARGSQGIVDGSQTPSRVDPEQVR